MTGAVAHGIEVLCSRARPPAAAGLRRARLLQPISSSTAPRLTTVVAPAGCGKTALLSHLAGDRRPLAWLTLEPGLADPEVLLAHLAFSLSAIPELTGGEPRSVEELLNFVDQELTEPVVLVVDDIQSIAGTPAQELIRLLLSHQPALLRIVLAGRNMPSVGLERYRLTAEVLEIGADELRFRSWEVEELFRSWDEARLTADDAARLTRQTAGWAAGLELFRLATTGRTSTAGHDLLRGEAGGQLTSRYLAEQVLQQLSAPLRDFVVRTSVLTRLSAQRCDQLLDTSGSGDMLAELERLGLLSSRSEIFGSAGYEYRHHEVLQTHLLDQLEMRLGPLGAREMHHRAGLGWLADGAHADAVQSFCRAQDWDSVRSVISVGGRNLAADHGSWLDLLPPSIRSSDPWVLLAAARRLLADGALQPAISMYEDAMAAFPGPSGRKTAERELHAVRSWTRPELGSPADVHRELRLAFIDPAAVSAPRDSAPASWCAYGIASLAMGRVEDAAHAFDTASRQREMAPFVESLAALGTAVVLTMVRDPRAPRARQRAGLIAAVGDMPSLERIGDGLSRLIGSRGVAEPVELVDDLLITCANAGDEWGEAMVLFFATLRGLAVGRPTIDTARRAGDRMVALRAPALAIWARVAEAIAAGHAGRAWSGPELDGLDSAASGLGPVPRAFAQLARLFGTADRASADDLLRRTQALADGSPLAPWIARIGDVALSTRHSILAPPATTSQCIRVLGEFDVRLNGVSLSTAGLRPLHRELFAVFCAHAGQLIHRDQLLEWFWPDSDAVRAQHSLQVAVSELRRLLGPTEGRQADVGLVREGSGYRLAIADPINCDAREFDRLVDVAHTAERRGDRTVTMAALSAATSVYRGDLIPSAGYPEWVLAERERLRLVVAGAYERLVELRAEVGDHAGAVVAARAGLSHDRHRDGLWRQLVTSLLALDDRAAAAAARRSYQQLLVELGVSAD